MSTLEKPSGMPDKPSSDLDAQPEDANPRNVLDGERARSNAPGGSTKSRLPQVERLHITEWFARAENLRSSQDPDQISSAHQTGNGVHIVTAYYQDVPGPGDGVTNLDRSDMVPFGMGDHGSTGPLRLVISSELLVRELQLISNVYLHQRPLALIPPFKLLVHNWEAIKKRVRALEETHSGPANVRLQHLQCLHDFIQNDLAYLIGLKKRIEEATIREVSFDELYFAFQPGDLVVSHDTGTDQLYCVYGVTGGRMRLMNVDKSSPSFSRGSKGAIAGVGTWTDVVIECFTIGWDGTQLGPLSIKHRIHHFNGRMTITDLDVYPLRYLDNAQDICQRLRLRGRRSFDCSGHKKHSGLTVPPHWLLEKFRFGTREVSFENSWFTWEDYAKKKAGDAEIRELNSDVYIDYRQGFRYNFEDHIEIGDLERSTGDPREVNESISSLTQMDISYASGDHDVDGSRTNDFLVRNRQLVRPSKPAENFVGEERRLELLSPFALAYDFKSRSWIWTDVRNLEDIDKSEEAKQSGWNELVIPPQYRKLLLSLVESHSSDSGTQQWADRSQNANNKTQIDLVRGKGRGLIILLHGPPGTGKTSTAETIAAYTGRPLYSITCGDIGTNPATMEEQLARHTRLAEEWGCVLLLDEADVFLEQRSWKDTERNALVSIFLRQMEFYSGILFLTTNMVGVIDEAFRSRIHLSLQFPSIDLQYTLDIWRMLLQRIDNDNKRVPIKIKFNEKKLLKFAQKHYESHERSETTWNGRQIRNAFQLAIAMDQHDRLQQIRNAPPNPDQEPLGPKSNSYIQLKVENFRAIARTAHEFETYMSSFMDSTAHRAKDVGVRNDYHDLHRLREPREDRRGNEWLNSPAWERQHTTAESSRRGDSAKGKGPSWRHRADAVLERQVPSQSGRKYKLDREYDDDDETEDSSSDSYEGE